MALVKLKIVEITSLNMKDKLDIVNRIDDKFPFRVYELSNGDFYPSATSVTGLVHEKEIEKWRKAVGEKRANKVCQEASAHGTRFHELMERKLNGEEIKLSPFHEFYNVNRALERQIYPNISNVKFVEKQLFSTSLRCAGTVDLLADWDGETAIIDWKTTRKEKTMTDVSNYFAQLSAYAYMIRENYGIVAKRMVLVFNEADSTVYTLQQTDIQKWVNFFMKYRKLFYRRYKI